MTHSRQGECGFALSEASQFCTLSDYCVAYEGVPLITADAGERATDTPSAPHRIPTSPGSEGRSPQVTHRRHGIPRHTAAPLLEWIR